MDYVLNNLQESLDNEYKALAVAESMTVDGAVAISNVTEKAFQESKRLANERIPQLEKAIEVLKQIKP